MSGKLAAVIIVAGVLVWGAAVETSVKVQVLTRAQLGNYVEDLTYITHGLHANHLAAVTAYGLYAQPLNSQSASAMKKLFDLRPLGITSSPRGVAYIESERVFAFAHGDPPADLIVADARGREQPRRTIHYLNGFVPAHPEGLAYIPSSSPAFPDHLVMAVWETPSLSRFEIMTRSGQVVAEILPSAPNCRNTGVGGVTYYEPGYLLIGCDDELHLIDFSGVTVSTVFRPDWAFTEGLVQVRDGRIAATSGYAGVEFFDALLNPLPGSGKDFTLGFGLALPKGVAWDSMRQRHLVNIDRGLARTTQGTPSHEVFALPPSFESAAPVVDLGAHNLWLPGRLSYLPAEDLIAVSNRHDSVPHDQRVVGLYDSLGNEAARVSFSERPLAVEFIPTTNEFAMQFLNEPAKVKFYTRFGVPTGREFDLAATAGAPGAGSYAFFNPSHPSGGQFLFMVNSNRALVTDFNGVLLDEFNYRYKLNLMQPFDVAAISSGEAGDTFSAVDREGGEIVVFRLKR